MPASPPHPRAVSPVRALIAAFAAAVGALTGVGVLGAPDPTSVAAAATPMTVAQAVADQSGATATVRGYVVGQPTATSTVVRSNFPNDYALAIADRPDETATSAMLYVQIPSALRAAWGLRSNPSLMGRQIDVTGTLAAYFSHPGMTSTANITFAGAAPTATTTTATPSPTSTTTSPSPSGTTTAPAGYYAGTEGLTGAALEAKLTSIISNQRVLTYDQVWTALKNTDEDPANTNNVIELYTGWSTPKTNNGGLADNWNREHVWAKSHGDFGTANGPGTDLHHVRPTDVTVNADRGNLDFDNGGTQNAEAPGNYADADSWEPRDAVKGDVARMIFYMSVRYEGGDGFADLEVNDRVANGTAPLHGKLSTLKAWHAADPPSAFEQRRNERIYANWQGNRNPFVDNPQWVEAIW